LESRQKNA